MAPNFSQLGCCPSTAGMLRVLSIGELQVTTCSLEGGQFGAVKTYDALKECLQNASEQDVKSLGLKFFHGTLSKGQMLWIPTGWYACEFVAKGPLCLGCRKSVFLNTKDGQAAYLAAIAMHPGGATGNKSVEAIRGLFTP